MTLKFVFVRHAEALHNKEFHDSNNDKAVFMKKELKDAPLTEKGLEQARELAVKLSEKYKDSVELWSSPLSRCIQTANEIFEELDVEDYYVHDNLIERQSVYYFNNRIEKSKLKEQHPHINMNFLSDLPSYWANFENDYSLRSRMHMLMLLFLNLYKDENKTVIIVGHQDAIQTLTSKSLKNAEYFEMSEEEIRSL